jgi:SPP1 gp7 family putative phage head morphogenesis protein
LSSNEYLTDAASRHAVFIQRYSRGVERIAGARLEEITKEIVKLVIDGNISNVRTEVETLYEGMEQELLEMIIEFAEQEGEFSIEMLEKATQGATFTPVESEQIARFIRQTPMDVAPGRQVTITQALSQFSLAKINQIELTLSDARTEGLTQMETVRKIRQLTPLQKTQAGALVRTANNAASTIAAFRTFEKNGDIFTGYKWVSTLDLNTTFVCMARDGQTYPFNMVSPIPPAHWGCRSVIIPKIKKKYDMFADLDGGRPSATGEQSARTTYGGWLKKQSTEFVEEALGKTRAKLFLSGKVKIDGFTDPTGREYTLQELRLMNDLVL